MEPIIYAIKLNRLLTDAEAGILSAAAEIEAVAKYNKHPDMQNANMSLVGSVLMRIAAAKVLCLPAAEVSILRDKNGKPFVSRCGLFISLSHSKDLCVCAVCDSKVGVDIEYIKETFPERVAEKFFSHDERERASNAGENGRAADLYVKWTQKESLLKCSGDGLSGLSSVCEDGYRIISGIIQDNYAMSVCVKL